MVNPFIGTGGSGFGVGSTFPGPSAPFGMLAVSPDTSTPKYGIGFTHCAGYAYGDDYIYGFSHLHLNGTGVPDFGNLLTMPVSGEVTPASFQDKEIRSKYDKSTEKASPGYYTVTLKKWKVKVELTATPRTAYHRYTWDNGTRGKHVLLRLDHALPGGQVLDSKVTLKSATKLEGWLKAKNGLSGRFGGLTLYFVVQSKQPFEGVIHKDGALDKNLTAAQHKRLGVWLKYPDSTDKVQLRVGISFVSIEGAGKNLAAEQKAWSLETLKKATEQRWEKLLSRVRIAGGSEKQQRIFYTALYHSFLMPNLLSDVDGQYRGLDQKVHKAEGFEYYSNFSLWDTYRTLHPLLVLLTPEIQKDMVKSLLQMAKDGGELPRWPLATGYTHTMVGASADIVIADTWLKGIRDFDVDFAYKAMRRLAMGPPPKGSLYKGRSHILDYVKYGYVTADTGGGSASVTMEYAYNDFAIAQLAKALGKKDDVALFSKRAKNYQKLWDPKTQFFRAKKKDGSWLDSTSNPKWDEKWSEDYVEGTAWQYLWFVPYDVPGLQTLFGGREAILKKLDDFWQKTLADWKKPNPFNRRAYYWHSNEPDIHAATLYLELGRPADAYKWFRWIMETQYKDAPDGLAGNDDGGTLSAWYVFAAMGLYPLPATTRYYLTSPIFTRVQLKLPQGTIEIQAPDTTSKAMFVQKVSLNGKEVKGHWIQHQDLVKDKAVLRFEMSLK
jgi:predicted alpha-1,2-mannosidase